MSKDKIVARIAAKIATFQIGDKINSLIYPSTEVEGELVEINKNIGVIETENGRFNTPLCLARKIVATVN